MFYGYDLLKDASSNFSPQTPDEEKIFEVFSVLLEFIHLRSWAGACHASSTVVFVLLREIGIEVSLCTGWTKCDKAVFGHSWVEYQDKPIDAAVSLANVLSFPPVILGYAVAPVGAPNVSYVYGYKHSAPELESPMDRYAYLSLGEYMDAFPMHESGLWGVACDLGKKLGLALEADSLRGKYYQEQWVLKS
ncbi:TPA: lasso peptide biosynthesis protein [Photobacterium damselae]